MSTESLPEPPPAQPSFLAGMLEPAVKIASLIGIGLYVIGLLVFNVFLAKYGITDFAALKPQCLFTGAWALLLLILAALPVAAFNSILAAKNPTRWKRTLLAILVSIAVAYFVTMMVTVLFGVFIGGPVYRESHFLVLDPGVPGWRGLLAVVVVLGIGTFIFQKPFEAAPYTWYFKTFVSLIAPSILGLLIIGHDICESVNPEVGGGRPLSATLYFGADGQQLLKFLKGSAAPFHDDEPDNVIKSELIYATNDRYLFRIIYCRSWELPATRETLRIAYTPVIVDKKLVQAIFYTGEKLFVYGDRCSFDGKTLKLKVP
jgi:hypothetical protein